MTAAIMLIITIPTMMWSLYPPRGSGTRNVRNNNHNNNACLFENVNFDDRPRSSTQRIGNFGPLYGGVGSSLDGPCSDPYNRGLNSDLVNTNGLRPRNTRSTLDIGNTCSIDDCNNNNNIFDNNNGPIGISDIGFDQNQCPPLRPTSQWWW